MACGGLSLSSILALLGKILDYVKTTRKTSPRNVVKKHCLTVVLQLVVCTTRYCNMADWLLNALNGLISYDALQLSCAHHVSSEHMLAKVHGKWGLDELSSWWPSQTKGRAYLTWLPW